MNALESDRFFRCVELPEGEETGIGQFEGNLVYQRHGDR